MDESTCYDEFVNEMYCLYFSVRRENMLHNCFELRQTCNVRYRLHTARSRDRRPSQKVHFLFKFLMLTGRMLYCFGNLSFLSRNLKIKLDSRPSLDCS